MCAASFYEGGDSSRSSWQYNKVKSDQVVKTHSFAVSLLPSSEGFKVG